MQKNVFANTLYVPDDCDEDDDNDGALDGDDSDDNDEFACNDDDGDTCDECSSGQHDSSNDGWDYDGDGACDEGDVDDDNDGALDDDDSMDNNIYVCSDDDDDLCDDCTSGQYDLSDDGWDYDGDLISDPFFSFIYCKQISRCSQFASYIRQIIFFGQNVTFIKIFNIGR